LRYEPQLYLWQLDQTMRPSWRELFKLKIEPKAKGWRPFCHWTLNHMCPASSQSIREDKK
jgi:hypothetical protein